MTNIKSITLRWLSKWYVIVSILIIAAAVVNRVRASQIPDSVSIPTPIMPTPNARDTFNEAEHQEMDSEEVDQSVGSPPLGKPPLGTDTANPYCEWHLFSWAEKSALVAENRKSLKIFQDGLAQEYMNPQPRSASDSYAYYDFDQDMSKLVQLQAEVEGHDGNWDEAMNSCLDIVQFGAQIQRGSSLAGMGIGTDIEERGNRLIRKLGLIDHLTLPQSTAAAKRLNAIDRSEVPYWSIMQEDAWMQEATLLDILHKRNWHDALGISASAGSLGDRIFFGTANPRVSLAQQVSFSAALYTVSRHNSYIHYCAYLNDQVAFSRLSWLQQGNAPFPEIDNNDPIARTFQMFSPIDKYGLADKYQPLVEYRLLETEIALRAYYLVNHSYPDTLSRLSLKYIPAVPLNPYLSTMPFYERKGEGYRLCDFQKSSDHIFEYQNDLSDLEKWGELIVKPDPKSEALHDKDAGFDNSN